MIMCKYQNVPETSQGSPLNNVSSLAYVKAKWICGKLSPIPTDKHICSMHTIKIPSRNAEK